MPQAAPLAAEAVAGTAEAGAVGAGAAEAGAAGEAGAASRMGGMPGGGGISKGLGLANAASGAKKLIENHQAAMARMEGANAKVSGYLNPTQFGNPSHP